MGKTAPPAKVAGKKRPEILHSQVVGAAQAKAHLLQIIECVRVSGRPIILTRRGKPTVQIVPLPSNTESPLFGRLSGIMQFSGDIVSPDLETWDSEA